MGNASGQPTTAEKTGSRAGIPWSTCCGSAVRFPYHLAGLSVYFRDFFSQDFLIRDRYASEKQLVGSLLTYLQHHLMKEETTHSFSLDSPHDTLVPPPVRSSTPPPTPVAFDETPGYFLPKKYHDVAVISRCVGKTKKDKKKVSICILAVCKTYMHCIFLPWNIFREPYSRDRR